MYKWLQITPEETLTDIHRAARFFYLQKNAFGGKVDNQTFGAATTSPPRLNLLRLEEDLSQAHLRLSQTYIEHLDWAECIANTTANIPCSTAIHPIGAQKAMA